jgi:tetratricopeptide (TPR) repeat protein
MSRASIAAVLFLAAAGSAVAQVPDKYTNLQVLPKDITKPDLVNRMREMAGSLGVRCTHCHVGPDDLQGMDFAIDEKATKRTARVMLRMVEEINASYLKRIETERAETTRVRCITCHRGLTVPRSIDEILIRSIEEKGVTAALAEYRELRGKYYGSGSYDFSQGPLNYIVEKLSREKKVDDALTLVNADIELNPDAAYPRVLLARLHLARGEKDQAIAALRKAVELDPKNDFIKKQLDELTAPTPSPK